MKITEIRTLISWAGLRNWLVVKLLTDTDLYGWGEATLEGKEQTVEAAVHQLGDQLIGQGILAVEHHWQVLYRHGFWRRSIRRYGTLHFCFMKMSSTLDVIPL